MTEAEREAIINHIMFLHYEDEPWCKIIQRVDFDVKHYTGIYADEGRQKHCEDEIRLVEEFARDPRNPQYQQEFLAYFVETISTDYTDESTSINPLEHHTWLEVTKEEACDRLDEIVNRAARLKERMKDSRFYDPGSYDTGLKRLLKRSAELQQKFLQVFRPEALYFINVDKQQEAGKALDVPSVLITDTYSSGLFFLPD